MGLQFSLRHLRHRHAAVSRACAGRYASAPNGDATDAPQARMTAARAPYPDALRGYGILLVACIHAFAYLDLPVTGGWAVPWFLAHQIAVPIFFLADGWITATRHKQGYTMAEGGQMLLASARRLMVPWAVFSLLYLATRMAGERAGVLGGETVLPDGVASIPLALWRGAAAGHLYFLPALLLVRAATVPLLRLVAGRPGWAAALAVLLMVGWRGVIEPFFPPAGIGVEPLLAACTGLGFAALGWALAMQEQDTDAPVWHVPLAAGAGCLIAAAALDGRGQDLAAQTGYLLLVWTAARSLGGNAVYRGFAWLGPRTMQIYLLHSPILIKLACDVLRHTHVPLPAALVLAVSVAVALSLAVASVLQRIGLGWVWGAPRRS